METKQQSYSIISRFNSVVFLFFVALFIAIHIKINKTIKESIQDKLNYSSLNIVDKIDNLLEHEEDKLKSIISIIVEQKISYDYIQIESLLKIFFHNLKLLNSVGWIDNKYIQKINIPNKLKQELDLKYNNYIKNTSLKPSILYFGHINGKSIAIALGSHDKSEIFLGGIVGNIDLEILEKQIYSLLKNENINFLLTDLEHKTIFNSAKFDIKNYIAKKDILHPSIISQNSLDSKTINNISYTINRLNKLPFILILESNHANITYKDYLSILILYKFELLALLVIISGLLYLFYHSIIDPFMMLSKIALSISNGNTSIFIPNKFNSKEASIIATSLEKIRFFLINERNITTELNNVENKLSIANLNLENQVSEKTKKLERNFTNKTKFLDQLIDQINTPLKSSSTITNNLVSYWDELTDKMRFEFANQASYTINKTSSLVTNLIETNNLSNKKQQLYLSYFNFTDSVSSIIKECSNLYMYKKLININFNNNKIFYVTADKNKIEQVIRNLIINSINNGYNNDSIGIKINSIEFRNNKSLQLIIHDKNTVIKREELAVIFSPLANNITDPNLLRLKVCYKIIESHSGKIWGEINKDGGATFNFIIPESIPIENEEKKSNSPLYKDLSLDKPNILLIDDEEVCLGSMELILHNSNYNLIKCNSAYDGLEFLKNNYKNISLIMLDLMMPDMYGLNVLAEIKKTTYLDKIPVMLQTGSSDEGEILKAFNMGLSCFIRKPYKKNKVLEKIKKALNLYQLNNKIKSGECSL